MIYLDNAATSGKKPKNVVAAVTNTLINLSANPGRSGHKLSERAEMLVYDTRNKISNYFGASGPEKVGFTANCTMAINAVIKGIVSKNGHIITTDFEHNAVMRPIVTNGYNYTSVSVSFSDKSKTLNEIEKAIKDNTELIIVTAASNVFGFVTPIKEIGQIAKKHGIPFAVDGAQGAGVIDLDMKKNYIDYLCVAPHKGLYSPSGIGILIAEKNIKNTLIEGGTGSDSVNLFQPRFMPDMIESGTQNLIGIAGINAGIDFIYSNKNLYKKEIELASILYDQLSRIEGVVLYTKKPVINEFVAVVSFNIEGLSSQKTAALLNDSSIAVRAGLHCAPTAHIKMKTIDIGTVRISIGYFNTLQEILSTVSVIKKIAKRRKNILNE